MVVRAGVDGRPELAKALAGIAKMRAKKMGLLVSSKSPASQWSLACARSWMEATSGYCVTPNSPYSVPSLHCNLATQTAHAPDAARECPLGPAAGPSLQTAGTTLTLCSVCLARSRYCLTSVPLEGFLYTGALLHVCNHLLVGPHQLRQQPKQLFQLA